MIKVLAPYLLGGALIGAGGAEIGLVALLYAAVRDWRFWLIGFVGFIVGLKLL